MHYLFLTSNLLANTPLRVPQCVLILIIVAILKEANLQQVITFANYVELRIGVPVLFRYLSFSQHIPPDRSGEIKKFPST